MVIRVHSSHNVIKSICNLISLNIRDIDLFARWGGEEFMVLLSKSDAAKAQIVAEKIRTSVMHHDFPEVGNITVSIGICEVSQELSILKMIDRADQALYAAKENGRNQVVVADSHFKNVSASN